MAISPHILQTCYRHVLHRVSNIVLPDTPVNYSNIAGSAPFTFHYTFTNFSMAANDYLQSLFEQGHHVVFAWEKQYRDLVVVTKVGGSAATAATAHLAEPDGSYLPATREGSGGTPYRILKAGMLPDSNNYYTKTIWAEYTLVNESQQLWRYLCDISRFVLNQDLNVIAHTILRAPVILEEIWRRTCHPSVVERFIDRCGGLDSYINGEEVSPVCMLRGYPKIDTL